MPPVRSSRVSQRIKSPRLAARVTAAVDAATTLPAAANVAPRRRSTRHAAVSAPGDVITLAAASLRRSPRLPAARRRPRAYCLKPDPALRLASMSSSCALRHIARRPYEEQIALHLANPGLYVRDYCEGNVYCWIEVDKDIYHRVVAGTISRADLWKAPSLRVKFGSAKNLSRRRLGYAKCDAGNNKRLWLFSFKTTQRYRLGELTFAHL